MTLTHPITAQSFAIIDHEIGEHNFSQPEYEIVRRIIHTTADFEFKHLIEFSGDAIAKGIAAISQGQPIVVDVGMVKQGIISLVAKTFANPVINALDYATDTAALDLKETKSAIGMRKCLELYPEAIFAIGNAPTALLTLCELTTTESSCQFKPSLAIGTPVGFVSVLEAKSALLSSKLPYICVKGRKGGSPVAAAIINALVTLAWQNS